MCAAVMSAVGLRCTLPARPHIRSQRAQRCVGPFARDVQPQRARELIARDLLA